MQNPGRPYPSLAAVNAVSWGFKKPSVFRFRNHERTSCLTGRKVKKIANRQQRDNTIDNPRQTRTVHVSIFAPILNEF
jgi:hypothetical protein